MRINEIKIENQKEINNYLLSSLEYELRLIKKLRKKQVKKWGY